MEKKRNSLTSKIPKKNKRLSVTALLSEKALAKDWNKPEEDKAWAKLQ